MLGGVQKKERGCPWRGLHCFLAVVIPHDWFWTLWRGVDKDATARSLFIVAFVPHGGADRPFSTSHWGSGHSFDTGRSGETALFPDAKDSIVWGALQAGMGDQFRWFARCYLLDNLWTTVIHMETEQPIREMSMGTSKKALSIPETQLLPTIVQPVLLGPCVRTCDQAEQVGPETQPTFHLLSRRLRLRTASALQKQCLFLEGVSFSVHSKNNGFFVCNFSGAGVALSARVGFAQKWMGESMKAGWGAEVLYFTSGRNKPELPLMWPHSFPEPGGCWLVNKLWVRIVSIDDSFKKPAVKRRDT